MREHSFGEVHSTKVNLPSHRLKPTKSFQIQLSTRLRLGDSQTLNHASPEDPTQEGQFCESGGNGGVETTQETELNKINPVKVEAFRTGAVQMKKRAALVHQMKRLRITMRTPPKTAHHLQVKKRNRITPVFQTAARSQPRKERQTQQPSRPL